MELIRYSLLGKEDLNFGKGTFDVRLADGRVVTLSQIDVGAILGNSALSTQVMTLLTLALTNLTVSGAMTVSGTITISGTLDLSSVTLTGALDLTGGGQIKFPATQIPSSNANTLDDYEEGNWTPSVGGTATYTGQFGKYTKIGNLLHVSCFLTINTIGTGSRTAISGFPFTFGADGTGPVYFINAGVSLVNALAWVQSGISDIALVSSTAAGASMTTINNVMGDGTMILFSLTARV